jgi:hypothetical protein
LSRNRKSETLPLKSRADPQINEQIVLYVLGRTVLSFIPRLYSSSATAPAYPFSPLPHPLPPLTAAASNPRAIPPANLPFSIVAALSWAGVMYMFRHRGERLQPGMGASMSELRRTAGKWKTGGEMTDEQNTCITIPRLGMTFGRFYGITSERGDTGCMYVAISCGGYAVCLVRSKALMASERVSSQLSGRVG